MDVIAKIAGGGGDRGPQPWLPLPVCSHDSPSFTHCAGPFLGTPAFPVCPPSPSGTAQRPHGRGPLWQASPALYTVDVAIQMASPFPELGNRSIQFFRGLSPFQPLPLITVLLSGSFTDIFSQ